MVVYGTPVGSLASQIAGLERRLAEFEANADLNAVLTKLRAVAELHPMAHGPEDRNWCWTCNVQFPCPTRRAVGDH